MHESDMVMTAIGIAAAGFPAAGALSRYMRTPHWLAALIGLVLSASLLSVVWVSEPPTIPYADMPNTPQQDGHAKWMAIIAYGALYWAVSHVERKSL